jgi:hypothetical protein
MSNCWLLKGKCLNRQPLEYYGFVYRITVSDSDDLPVEMRGRIYIGKKQFQYKKRKVISKRRRVATGTKKRVEKSFVDSKWLGYFGSSKQLMLDVKNFGEKYFKREILHLCFNKAQLSYYEVKEQIAHDVLSVNSYNGWISCKIFKNRFTQTIMSD